jgi:hypothetical protein
LNQLDAGDNANLDTFERQFGFIVVVLAYDILRVPLIGYLLTIVLTVVEITVFVGVREVTSQLWMLRPSSREAKSRRGIEFTVKHSDLRLLAKAHNVRAQLYNYECTIC